MTEQIELEIIEEVEELVELETPSANHRDEGFDAYMRQISRYPMLTIEEEYDYIKRWQKHRESRALDKLVNSHLRLAAKIAGGYLGYGLPLEDLLSEGTVGILKAVDRFDTEKGFRFSTYATWWIQAAVKEYILRSWSMVRLGTSANQKKLFFQLRKLKMQMRSVDANELPSDYIEQISRELDIGYDEVLDMNNRMSGPDFSLNAQLADDEGAEWQDALEDERDDQETALISTNEQSVRSGLLASALKGLTEREYRIFSLRHLNDDPPTLSIIADEMGISRERVRQIEAAAFNKVQRSVRSQATEQRVAF